jgi:hypothetical protein
MSPIAPEPTADTVDGIGYPVDQTDNSVRPEDGDQSDAYAEVDFGDGEDG